MAESRTIICEGCDQPYETARHNTKRCARCALLRNLEFLGTRSTRTCDVGRETFAPLERGDTTCASCVYQPKKFGEATCLYCQNQRLRVRPGVDVCHWCARDPKLRGRFIHGLKLGQARRQREAA